MNHFKIEHDQREGIQYVYDTSAIGESVEIRLYYYKDARPRGIQMTVNTVTHKQDQWGKSTSYDLMAGLYLCVYPLPRKSDKTLQNATEYFDQYVECIATTWQREGKDVTKALVRNMIAKYNDPNFVLIPPPAATEVSNV